jgi:hypothetical protein
MLKERPLLRLKLAKVSRPYLLLKRDQNELVAVFPLSERENRWAILERLVRWRDFFGRKSQSAISADLG